jgi:ABC-type antimicrobial peptide transport system permease subunit
LWNFENGRFEEKQQGENPVAPMFVCRALTSSLYGVKPLDAASYLIAVVGVASVALAASALPARRAASVDPMTALRTE